MRDERVTVLGRAVLCCWLLRLLLLLPLPAVLVASQENGSNETTLPLPFDDPGGEQLTDDPYEDDAVDVNSTDPTTATLRRGLARLTFNNCGEDTDPLYITGFDVTPNPVEIPGPLAVGISFRLNQNISSPILVQLEMKKKLNFLFGLSTWFTIPCLPSGVGSCDYPDICKLGLFSKDVCLNPETDEEIPCKCPFYEGDWKMHPSMFNIPRIPDDIPSYLLQGEFSIKATLFKDDQQIACYSTDVEINL